ncbi:hypothetical protein GCM10007425_26930 [Lysinibacillus alkalisoli]|uniref:Uncharacterized protein n=1 Tax=Lysinibacillus alkalisoli TaxID=1911548 RepID=A0A917LIZ7_9BACI|nr:hypothetical protein GCM10007425_26930 [Lysinibacillus alkalisoli]
MKRYFCVSCTMKSLHSEDKNMQKQRPPICMWHVALLLTAISLVVMECFMK